MGLSLRFSKTIVRNTPIYIEFQILWCFSWTFFVLWKAADSSKAKNTLGWLLSTRKRISKSKRKNVIFHFQCRVATYFSLAAPDKNFQIFENLSKPKSINDLVFPKRSENAKWNFKSRQISNFASFAPNLLTLRRFSDFVLFFMVFFCSLKSGRQFKSKKIFSADFYRPENEFRNRSEKT